MASLAPFFLLAAFSHPTADDYVYAVRARELGFVGAQRLWYTEWTGRYFATALQSGFPLVVDMLTAYPLVPLLTLVGLLGGLALVARLLNGRLQEPLERGAVWLGVLGFAAVYTTQMPSLIEGIYWLAGVATYEQSLVLVLLLAACLVWDGWHGHLARERWTPARRQCHLLGRMAAAALLALAIAGSNEPVFAVADVLLLAGTVVAVRRKHPSRWVWITALAACAAGSLVVALAPGNALRTMQFDKPPLLTRAAHCVGMGVRHALAWSIRPMLLGATVLAIPLAGRIAQRGGWARRITGRHVAAAAAANVVLVIVSFAPAYYGMGRMPPPRALNVAYFFFLAGWFATLLAAVAWRQNCGAGVSPAAKSAGETPAPLSGAPLSGRAMVLGRVGFIAGMLLVGHWPGAVYDLVFLAPSFDRQLRARYETLDALSRSGETTAAVERLSVRPESLSFDDVGDQSAHTEFVARYFGLSGLTVTVDGKPWSPEARP